jgi:hypothetical protein
MIAIANQLSSLRGWSLPCRSFILTNCAVFEQYAGSVEELGIQSTLQNLAAIPGMLAPGN